MFYIQDLPDQKMFQLTQDQIKFKHQINCSLVKKKLLAAELVITKNILMNLNEYFDLILDVIFAEMFMYVYLFFF